jgi:hypothetical protein
VEGNRRIVSDVVVGQGARRPIRCHPEPGGHTPGPIDTIGVDEIHYAKDHKDLALAYQIDLCLTRLL